MVSLILTVDFEQLQITLSNILFRQIIDFFAFPQPIKMWLILLLYKS